MPIPLTMPLTSKSKSPAIGAGRLERKGTYFGMFISLGEAICNGPVIAGVVSGGTGVAAATGAAGELAASAAFAGGALGVPGAVPPELSAHALWAQAIRKVRSSAHTRLPNLERPARCSISNFLLRPLCCVWKARFKVRIGHTFVRRLTQVLCRRSATRSHAFS